MSIQYAGGTIVNTTYTSDGTRQGIVTALNTQLKNAGWTAVSGDGTSNVIMQTATTPQGALCQVRLLEPGSGNCAQVFFRNSGATLIANAAFLLPTNGAVFRILANKYQFFFFQSGAGNVSNARTCVMGGALWLPSFMVTNLGSDLQHWWSHLNGSSDTATTALSTFRNTVQSLFSNNSGGSAMMGSILFNYTAGFDIPGVRGLTVPGGAGSAWAVAANWLDGSLPLGDAIVNWGSSSAATPNNTRGLMWDAFVLFNGSLNSEATITGPDGNTFMVITHSTTSQLCVRSA